MLDDDDDDDDDKVPVGFSGFKALPTAVWTNEMTAGSASWTWARYIPPPAPPAPPPVFTMRFVVVLSAAAAVVAAVVVVVGGAVAYSLRYSCLTIFWIMNLMRSSVKWIIVSTNNSKISDPWDRFWFWF